MSQGHFPLSLCALLIEGSGPWDEASTKRSSPLTIPASDSDLEVFGFLTLLVGLLTDGDLTCDSGVELIESLLFLEEGVVFLLTGLLLPNNDISWISAGEGSYKVEYIKPNSGYFPISFRLIWVGLPFKVFGLMGSKDCRLGCLGSTRTFVQGLSN